MKYYVYAYVDPTNNQVFYIGKGTGNRYLKHLKETYETTENKKKYSHIKGLKNKGLEPIVVKIMDNMEESAAYELETKLIKFFGRKGIDEDGCLTNICIDNRPPSALGKKLPEAQKQKLSIERRGSGNPMFGKKQTEKYFKSREKLTGRNNPFYGKTHSQDSIDKMLKSRHDNGSVTGWPKGTPRSAETRTKLSDTWLVTDPDGNEFEVTNLREYAESIGLHPETLRTAQFKKKGKTKCGWKAVKMS